MLRPQKVSKNKSLVSCPILSYSSLESQVWSLISLEKEGVWAAGYQGSWLMLVPTAALYCFVLYKYHKELTVQFCFFFPFIHCTQFCPVYSFIIHGWWSVCSSCVLVILQSQHISSLWDLSLSLHALSPLRQLFHRMISVTAYQTTFMPLVHFVK